MWVSPLQISAHPETAKKEIGGRRTPSTSVPVAHVRLNSHCRSRLSPWLWRRSQLSVKVRKEKSSLLGILYRRGRRRSVSILVFEQTILELGLLIPCSGFVSGFARAFIFIIEVEEKIGSGERFCFTSFWRGL
jgi:hypothetical protein